MIIKPHIKKVVYVAAIGAACGAFLQFALGMFSACRPSSSVEKSSLHEIIIYINTPLHSFVDFIIRKNLMASDDMSRFLIMYFIYGMLVGMSISLAGYFFKHLVKYLDNYVNNILHIKQ